MKENLVCSIIGLVTGVATAAILSTVFADKKDENLIPEVDVEERLKDLQPDDAPVEKAGAEKKDEEDDKKPEKVEGEVVANASTDAQPANSTPIETEATVVNTEQQSMQPQFQYTTNPNAPQQPQQQQTVYQAMDQNSNPMYSNVPPMGVAPQQYTDNRNQ
jgi:hypothetical protein